VDVPTPSLPLLNELVSYVDGTNTHARTRTRATHAQWVGGGQCGAPVKPKVDGVHELAQFLLFLGRWDEVVIIFRQRRHLPMANTAGDHTERTDRVEGWERAYRERGGVGVCPLHRTKRTALATLCTKKRTQKCRVPR
jgi:hypothetical protein